MQPLTLLTWNVGYGAMGTEAEIALEGGRYFIPSYPEDIQDNLRGIEHFLREHSADVLLLQELSLGSLLNYWHSVHRVIHQALKHHRHAYTPNFRLPLPFLYLRNEHGLATFVRPRHKIIRKKRVAFSTREVYYRILERRDSFLVTYVRPHGAQAPLVVLNAHLATFDEGGTKRQVQFKEMLTYAQRVHQDKGYAVVIGADWNMLLNDAVRMNATERAYYEPYVYHFPTKRLPEGWTLHASEGIPTMRMANRRYSATSATATVDGFVCSPGIRVESVKTIDLHFAHSDHNPVELRIHYSV